MATKEYLHNLDLVGAAQLLNARLHNVTDTEMTALAATLGAGNKGLVVYNTDQSSQFIWDGTQFTEQSVEVDGDLIFRGVLAAADYDENNGGYTTGPEHRTAGSQYAISEAGTLDIDGVTTYIPGATVEAGDQIIFSAPDTVYVLQRNDGQATEASLGNVRLATQAETNTGTNDIAAVTPLKLHQKLVNSKYPKQYNATVNLVALTPLNVPHNLNLSDRDALHVTTMFNNREISVQVDSVDANNITLTSIVARNGVRVTVSGAPAA